VTSSTPPPSAPAPAGPVGQPDGRAATRGRAWATALAVVALTWAVFLPVLGFGFISLDDPDYVARNPHVARGLTLESLRWAAQAVVVANWHPLTMLSHLVDVELYGLDPRGHHLTNLLLHLANTALVFLLVRRFGGGLGGAGLVAAWFGIHPLHVESVAWVAERKDLLSALFFLLSLLAWERWVVTRRRWRYVVALAWFACGLLAKPMVVTLPCILLLLDLWPLGRLDPDALRSPRRALPALWPLLREKLPFFLLTAAASALTLATQDRALSALANLSIGARLANASTAYATYLEQTLWPTGLAILYPLPRLIDLGAALPGALLLLLVSLLAVARLRTAPWLAVGWFWFVGMLVPVIGLVQVGRQAHADRYMYLPILGLLIVLVWGGGALAAERPRLRRLLTVGALLSLPVLGVLTRVQLATWRDDRALFTQALAVTEDNVVAHLHLAILLAETDPQAAEGHFAEVFRLEPGLANAHAAYANALRRWGRPAEALPHAQRAIALAPASGRLYLALAAILDDLGRGEEAIAALETAATTSPANSPDAATAHQGLATLLAERGRSVEALAHARAALAIDPYRTALWVPTARLLAAQGELAPAIDLLLRALAGQASSELHAELAALLERAGRPAEAAHHRALAQSGPPSGPPPSAAAPPPGALAEPGTIRP
jgi:tetratricopeptide (TPR) repeat protein